MKAKDYYELKEVILGLKKEMLTNYALLQKLKESTILTDRRTSAVTYRISCDYNHPENPQVIAIFEEKKNALVRYLDKVAKKSGRYLYGENISHLVKEVGGYYYLNGHYDVCIHPQEQFAKDVEEILNTKYIRKIAGKILEEETPNTFKLIYIEPSSINSHITVDEKSKVLDYDSDRDEVNYFDFSDNIHCKDDILEILQQRIPKDNFNKYQKSIIDNSEDARKEIKIDTTSGENSAYQIEDESSKVMVLRRK